MTQEKVTPGQVLDECRALQETKGSDYQNPRSRVRQADYYPNGIDTLHDMLHMKLLRIRSLLDTLRENLEEAPNFEGVEDSAKDLINYASFLVSYARGGIDGQSPDRDMFNRPRGEGKG